MYRYIYLYKSITNKFNFIEGMVYQVYALKKKDKVAINGCFRIDGKLGRLTIKTKKKGLTKVLVYYKALIKKEKSNGIKKGV